MKISIIGAGAMGGAIAAGLLKVVDNPTDITLSNPSAAPLKPFAEAGCITTHDNCEAARDADIIMVVVKPWIVENVLRQIAPELDYSRQTIVVIAAGITSAQLTEWLDRDGALPSILLGMPNTAVAIGESMTFVVPIHAENSDVELVNDLFGKLGTSMVIDEQHLPAATTLASCGIAYAMRYIRAAMEGGVELGFKAASAQEIVVQTVKGAAALLSLPGSHPESEIDKVTTPGGLTIRGLNEMEHAGFTSAVIRGLKAGVK